MRAVTAEILKCLERGWAARVCCDGRSAYWTFFTCNQINKNYFYPQSIKLFQENGMRQVFRKIPVYTGDVSGVCSALFELGGMVVMHDPSGCNSTYNTHDEIRWYDHDSLIFISGLNDTDAIMGSDEKLIRDITEAAKIYSPSFIAIANSPIPYVTGMDFDAITRIIERETGIPTFYIMTNGMHDYTRGAGLAFLQIAKRFVEDPKREGKAVHKERSGVDAGIIKSGEKTRTEDLHVKESGEEDLHVKESAKEDLHVKGSGEENLYVKESGKKPRTEDLHVKESGEENLYAKEPGKEDLQKEEYGSQACEPGNSVIRNSGDCGNDRRIRVNILGLTPLDFTSSSSGESLRSKLLSAGTEIVSCWAMEVSSAKGENSGSHFSEKTADKNVSRGCRSGLLEDICRSATADVNLVISSTGLPAAEYMNKRFGIPYVAGIPAYGTEKIYFDALQRAVTTGKNQFPFRERSMFRGKEDSAPGITGEEMPVRRSAADLTDTPTGQFLESSPDISPESGTGTSVRVSDLSPICLIGEPVVMTSLAASLRILTGAPVHVFGMTEEGNTKTGREHVFGMTEEVNTKTVREHVFGMTEGGNTKTGRDNLFLGKDDAAPGGEEELQALLCKMISDSSVFDRDHIRVIADPCYQDILPEGFTLVRLPHLAFSGRIFLREIPDIIGGNPLALF